MENLMVLQQDLTADIQSLQSAYYDEDCYRGAVERTLREYAYLLDDNRRRSYEHALFISLQNLDCIRYEIEKRRANVGRVELEKEFFNAQKIAA